MTKESQSKTGAFSVELVQQLIQSYQDDRLLKQAVSVDVMRLDRLPLQCFEKLSKHFNGKDLCAAQRQLLEATAIREALSGNKYFKLGANLRAARQAGCKSVLSFGGRYSNHIFALAAASKLFGFHSIGVIRAGEESAPSATLQNCLDWGMQLESVSRSEYRVLRNADWATIAARFAVNPAECWIIPEGGANHLACLAMAELAGWIEHYAQWRGIAADSLTVALPCGTGGTLAGLRAALDARISVLGVPVLKAGDWLRKDIQQRLDQLGVETPGFWSLLDNFHSGGYARLDKPLCEFIEDQWTTHEVPLEPVYSGKLFRAMWSEIETGGFATGSHLLLLHTGGLQGIRGYLNQFGSLPWVMPDWISA